MTILPKSMLIVGSLTETVIAEFVDYLHARIDNDTNIYLLWTPSMENSMIDYGDSHYFDGVTIAKIFYGSSANDALVKRIVNEYNVDIIYHFHNVADASVSITESARRTLATHTSFLEAVRQCKSPPTIVAAFLVGNNSKIATSLTTDGRLSGSFRAASLGDANFASVIALLHSYAISYRLNIQALHMKCVDGEMATSNNVHETLLKMASLEKGSAPICSVKYVSGVQKNTTDLKPAARFLIYGDGNICVEVCSYLKTHGINHIVSQLRAESAPTDALRDEILATAPSHIVLLPHSLLAGVLDDITVYNSSGAQSLLKNARDNLFAPLQLVNICAQMTGIHFSYANAHTLEALRNLIGDTKFPTETQMTSPTAADEDDCFTTTKRFTDSTLSFFERDCLNLVFDARKDMARDNYAKFLVESALARKVGHVNANNK